jgi:hypothetical protein
MNLIMNASEAIGTKPGVVTVSTGVRDIGPGDLSVRSPTGEPLVPGRYVVLETRDDGSGMDEALLYRIFEPFFTTRATGRGLGLAATQGIVRGHRGGLRAVSAPGAGTTFTLLFPASVEGVDERHALASASPRDLVLVVDDEEAVREVINSVLEFAGFDTLVARDGSTAVQLFARTGRRSASSSSTSRCPGSRESRPSRSCAGSIPRRHRLHPESARRRRPVGELPPRSAENGSARPRSKECPCRSPRLVPDL